MPSRRKKRSCVKIRLLFWNTSCCLSISYFYTGILALTAWVKVSGSSHTKRITSGCIEKKEILILLLSCWYLLFLTVKAAATVLWNASFIQEISKVTLKQKGTWTYSPYSSKITTSISFTLLWRDRRTFKENSLQSNCSPEHEHLESYWILQRSTSQSERPFIWADSSLPDIQTLCYNDISVAVEEYLVFQAIYCNRNNLFLVTIRRPSICWTFGTDTFHPSWIGY